VEFRYGNGAADRPACYPGECTVDEIARLDAQICECERAIAALGPPSEKNRSAIAGHLRRRLVFRVRKETMMGRVDEE
jgi:hypothetical protein